jgi:V/A-type H+-transporting ATPase subunit C
MSGFEYGNARLRAMRSRLLSAREVEALVGIHSVRELIGMLTRTSYHQAVEAALMRVTDLEVVNQALRQDLAETVKKLRSFYQGSSRGWVDLFLRVYDLKNLKTVLRGLATHAPIQEMMDAFLPAGLLSENMLSVLARSGNPRAAIDLLATMGSPLAQPLLFLRVEQPGAELYEMEFALDRWHFMDAFRTLQNPPDEAQSLLSALRLQVDSINLVTLARFSSAPVERQIVQKRIGQGDLSFLFLKGGKLSEQSLARTLQSGSLKMAADVLRGTDWARPFEEGLAKVEQNGRLSALEHSLLSFETRWRVSQIAHDPLGFGVVLGYLALKLNEAANLRWIGHGVRIGLGADVIRAELEVMV